MSNSASGLERVGHYAAEREAHFPFDALESSRAGIVHDLGNLIQVALSGLYRVGRDPSLATARHLEPVIASATAALQSAGTLVRETIGGARESRRDIGLTNVKTCLAGIEALIQAERGPDIRLEVRVKADLPFANCDRLGLQNALLNLLLNARAAMPGGGLISVDATAINGGATPLIELRVADNGIGMTKETAARAFDPFFTTKGNGLGGVGLPTVKHFAEEHGGSVAIESTFGVGTTVILRLPAAIDLRG